MFTPLHVHSAASSPMHTAFANAARLQSGATPAPERSFGEAATATAHTCVLAFNRGMRWCRQALPQATGV